MKEVVVMQVRVGVANMATRMTRRAAIIAAATVAMLGLTAALTSSALASTAQSTITALLRERPYRNGVVPLRPGANHRGHNTPPAVSSTNNLMFRGGNAGVGVTTGREKVYLVFWGSQWGSQGLNSQGYTTLSRDPTGIAPDIQAFFKGLGTGGENWSGVMSQYCEGIATGAQTCPTNSTSFVAYPANGALAGVWVDESTAAPQQANGHQIGQEAVNAAAHFGNVTQTSNRDTQYVIVSPTGTNPDGFNTPSGPFCAWHDDTADSQLSGGAVNSPDGILAFTNMPYVTDAGAACGQNFVNSSSAGTDDGVTIVAGHEYAETITDQFPAGGWTDSFGEETGDKCAWINSGQGAATNLPLTTGTFAVQSTWANDFAGGAGGCETSHSVAGLWNQVSGLALDVSVGPTGAVWAIGADNRVYERIGSTFVQQPGIAVDIAVGPNGPWVVNAADRIFAWNGNGFTQVSGLALDIAAGPTGAVWVIGADNGIYERIGSTFMREPGAAVDITLGPTEPWVANATHTIFEGNF
jgi:hypothetical protein